MFNSYAHIKIALINSIITLFMINQHFINVTKILFFDKECSCLSVS